MIFSIYGCRAVSAASSLRVVGGGDPVVCKGVCHVLIDSVVLGVPHLVIFRKQVILKLKERENM